MKKIFLFSLLSFILGMNSAFAQDVLVANLSHNGTVTNFYGVNALKNAHEAAEHGDTIILSQGAFNPVNITKAVSILGAGMDLNADGQGTRLKGNFSIDISDAVNIPFRLEGIYMDSNITVSQATDQSRLSKCRIREVDAQDEITCMQCRIFYLGYGAANKYFYNCYVGVTHSVDYINAYNCVVFCEDDTYIPYSNIYNCIIRQGYNSFPNTATMYNNVTIGGDNNVYNNITAGGSNSVSTYADIFKNNTGTYDDTNTFELTDAAKTTYLGIDGTQVGIYGSATPYDTTPTIPLITSYQVAAKAANGKVSVNVEINGGED